MTTDAATTPPPDLAPPAAVTRLGYREATIEDFDFVQATLLNHYLEESFWAKRLTTRVYFDGHTPLVRSLLQQASVLIACQPDEPSLILGFVVFERGGGPDGGDVLDFLYVKKAWRRLGIGSMLMKATGLDPWLDKVFVTFCTTSWFRTKAAAGLEERYKATYWPYGQWRAFNPK